MKNVVQYLFDGAPKTAQVKRAVSLRAKTLAMVCFLSLCASAEEWPPSGLRIGTMVSNGNGTVTNSVTGLVSSKPTTYSAAYSSGALGGTYQAKTVLNGTDYYILAVDVAADQSGPWWYRTTEAGYNAAPATYTFNTGAMYPAQGPSYFAGGSQALSPSSAVDPYIPPPPPGPTGNQEGAPVTLSDLGVNLTGHINAAINALMAILTLVVGGFFVHLIVKRGMRWARSIGDDGDAWDEHDEAKNWNDEYDQHRAVANDPNQPMGNHEAAHWGMQNINGKA